MIPPNGHIVPTPQPKFCQDDAGGMTTCYKWHYGPPDGLQCALQSPRIHRATLTVDLATLRASGVPVGTPSERLNFV